MRQVAGEHADEVAGLRHAVGETQFVKQGLPMGDVFGAFDGRGIHRNVVAREDLSWCVISSVCFPRRVAVERVHE